jgi:hypothetical protein
MERHREQALLGAVGADSRTYVHEQAPLPLFHDEDPARLLDDVDPGRLRRRRRNVHGLVEAAGDADDAQLETLRARAGDGGQSGKQQYER